jgi:predicted  nucleic acid-binding Zn-ribbon protein
MSKQTIVWHENCLKNLKASTERMEVAVAMGQARLAAMKEEVKYNEAQIEEANRQGKPDFDSEKFLKSAAPTVRYWELESPRWV